jgi:hypothetical protein
MFYICIVNLIKQNLKNSTMKNSKLVRIASLFLIAFTFSLSGMAQSQVTSVRLTQVTGKFTTEILKLKPGQYQFEVTNQGVDKELGFVIQKEDDKDKDVMKTAVENSFTKSLIKKGETQSTGVVTLEKGRYVYSCPLNPTPKYIIEVK